MFAYLNGTVSNLVMENVDIVSNIAGGVAGVMKGGTVSNCVVSGSISRMFGENIGGIIGKQDGGSVINCTNLAVISGSANLGGIVGTTSGVVEGCVNEGEITGAEKVGGVIGSLSINNIEVKGNVNEGNITGTGDYVAGIIGYSVSYQVTMLECSSNGVILGRNYVGSAIGSGISIKIVGFINTASVTGRAVVGGVAGCSGELVSCKNEGAVSATGVLVDGSNSFAYFGGVAGYANGRVSYCENTVALTYGGAGHRMGGIVGYATNEVTYCQNTGDVSSLGNVVGGVVGLAGFSVTNVVNTGNVVGRTSVGGVVGVANQLVSACESSGTVQGTGNYVGGMLGRARANYSNTFTNCENYGDIRGASSLGRIVGLENNSTATTACISEGAVIYTT